jgi:hypothetical protein
LLSLSADDAIVIALLHAAPERRHHASAAVVIYAVSDTKALRVHWSKASKLTLQRAKSDYI